MTTIKFILVCITIFLIKAKSQKQGCQQVCQELQYSDCVVCYKQCEPDLYSSSNRQISFKFKNCTQRYCSAKRRIQSGKNGRTRSRSHCETYEYKPISEKKCLQKCCGESTQRFTKDNMEQCLAFNNEEVSVWDKIVGTAIVGALILAYFVLFYNKPKNKQQ